MLVCCQYCLDLFNAKCLSELVKLVYLCYVNEEPILYALLLTVCVVTEVVTEHRNYNHRI